MPQHESYRIPHDTQGTHMSRRKMKRAKITKAVSITLAVVALIMFALLMFSGNIEAQDSKRTTTRIETTANWSIVRSGNASTSMAITSQPIASISAAGEVMINWTVIDACLKEPKVCDATVHSWALLLRAARDGTWKPMQGKR